MRLIWPLLLLSFLCCGCKTATRTTTCTSCTSCADVGFAQVSIPAEVPPEPGVVKFQPPVIVRLETPRPKQPVVRKPAPEKKVVSKPKPRRLTKPEFRHSANYGRVIGVLQRVHLPGVEWKLRFAGLDENDQWGGSFVLATDYRIDQFRDGDVVYAEGRILQNRRSLYVTGPLYRVDVIRPAMTTDVARFEYVPRKLRDLNIVSYPQPSSPRERVARNPQPSFQKFIQIQSQKERTRSRESTDPLLFPQDQRADEVAPSQFEKKPLH